jgi:hypothetical protein
MWNVPKGEETRAWLSELHGPNENQNNLQSSSNDVGSKREAAERGIDVTGNLYIT